MNPDAPVSAVSMRGSIRARARGRAGRAHLPAPGGAANMPPMIVVNTETIAGYQIVEVKGIVQGNTVRAKHVGRDIAASLKNIVGGELRGYTELLTESRREAMERMLMQAQQLGANAVVNVRFSTSSVTAGAAELYAYGTAVVVRQDARGMA
jgi:uncharacterized protein YbjQ (UPF0145 family)